MAETERILNNRPITDVFSDQTDFSALTPNMLLTGFLDDGIPPAIFLDKESYRNSWRKTQALADQFCQKWRAHNLPALQLRNK